jgi:hypothetical protein
MHAHTIEQSTAPARAAGAARVVPWLGAAGFVVGAAWFGLATAGVTVAAQPQPARGAGIEQNLHAYYRWLVTTLPQERLYTSAAIVGFLCLAGAGLFAPPRGGDRALPRAGGYLVAAGAATWIGGSVLWLGGHRAIGLMATHANPIQAVNSIAFTIDTTADTVYLAAFALTGIGMLMLAGDARSRTGPPGAGWSRWAAGTAVVAVVLLATAVSLAAADDNLTNALLVADGIVLLPGWLLWTWLSQGTRPSSEHAEYSE